MHLQSSDLPAYAAHLATRDDSNAADVLERLRRAIAGARLSLDDIFVTFDPTGERVSGSVRVCVFGKDFVVLTEWRGDEDAGTYEALSELLAEATARAAEIEAPKMGTRVSLDGMTDAYRRALQDSGFVLQGRRVEYRTPVSELPDERTSRLTWTTMADVGEKPVLDLIREASADTPDGMDVEAGVSAIEDVLGGGYDTLDPRAVELGMLDGRAVAVLLTRVDVDTGWAGIQFLGIVPEVRGRGLGTDVHLHGIATMRDLGGTVYHDGTSETNAAMLRLFEKHGCIEHSRMEEWQWRPSAHSGSDVHS
jgi:ribosomal protein S18 acetylase RimI-like enzyme